jgi:hypothetical protein
MRGQNGFRDQSALNECGFAAAPEGACDGEMAASGSGNQQSDPCGLLASWQGCVSTETNAVGILSGWRTFSTPPALDSPSPLWARASPSQVALQSANRRYRPPMAFIDSSSAAEEHVFAAYGRAMHGAQNLEHWLRILVQVHRVATKRFASQAELGPAFNTLSISDDGDGVRCA